MAHRVLLLGIILLISFSCKKKPITATKEIKDLSTLLQVKDLDYDKMKLTGRMDLDMGSSKLNVGVQIRMIKDSAVWASFRGPMNIEGARALITKDSFHIINRLERSYILGNIASMKKLTGIDMNLQMLQNAIVGNMPIAFQQEDSLDNQDSSVVIRQLRGGYQLRSTLDKQIGRMVNMRAVSPDKSKIAMIDLSDFQALSPGRMIPMKVNILLAQPNSEKRNKRMDIDLKNAEDVNEELELPFAASSSYKKIVL